MSTPAEHGRTLPVRYALFEGRQHDLQRHTSERPAARREDTFNEVYHGMWTTLCMTIDARRQGSLISSLRSQLRAPGVTREEHAGYIANYRRDLEEASVYPIYQQVASAMQEEGYARRVVQNWDLAGKKYSPVYRARVLDPVASIYPYIANDRLIDLTYGRQIGRVSWNTLDALETALAAEEVDEPDRLRGYVGAIQLLTSARTITSNTLSSQISQFEQVNQGRMTIEVPDWNERFRSILKTTEPYHYFAVSLSRSLQETENDMFGENAELASTLWRATVLMRSSQRLQSQNITDIRADLMRNLVQGNYEGARTQMLDLIEINPQLFPPFVAEALQR